MSCKPSDLRDFANSLIDDSSEVNLRTVLNKAYYAAYHTSLEHVSKNGSDNWTSYEGGVHKTLITNLEKSKILEEKSAGFILRALRSKRVIADYHLHENLLKEDAVSSLKMLDSLIVKLSAV